MVNYINKGVRSFKSTFFILFEINFTVLLLFENSFIKYYVMLWASYMTECIAKV